MTLLFSCHQKLEAQKNQKEGNQRLAGPRQLSKPSYQGAKEGHKTL